MQKFDTGIFQGSILALQDCQVRQDCTIVQPLGMEVGAGISHPMTCLRVLGPESMATVYVRPSHHPIDGRYGENPNRLQHYYQFQVVVKPSPDNIQKLYLGPLEELGMDPTTHDIRLVKDNWENLMLGAWGLSWEIWSNGIEMTQFVYFQQVGGLECKLVTGEITYGLERLAMYIQGVDSVYGLVWSDGSLGKITYGDVFHQDEVEQSTYNLEYTDVNLLFTCLEQYEEEAQQLLALGNPLPLPAYERILKAAHGFDLLDVRKAIPVTERQCYTLRIRTLTRTVTEAYYASREALGFPMCNKDKQGAAISEKTFLVEISTEELPPRALRSLAEFFAANFTTEPGSASLVHGTVQWFATLRHLALKVANLAEAQPDREIERHGPVTIQAFDAEGKSGKATEGWAHGCGTIVDQAEHLTTDKGEWLLYRAYMKGKDTETLLPNMVATSLAKLPIPKLMRWGTDDVHFVYPVHTVTLLLSDKVTPATILDIQSDRVTRGHHFMGRPGFTIDNTNQYPGTLRERGKVIVNYEEREAKIKADTEEAAYKIGGNADLGESLLEEVISLVKWSIVLTTKFGEKFLTVPSEALVYTMKGDQGYLSVYVSDGKLLPNFIFVVNIESKDPQQIVSDNEKVIHPRLADAEFFFNADRKKRLENDLPRLQTVLFQQQLGTLCDKTDRIRVLASWIAGQIGADVNHATRADLLSKCDLMVNVVFEFTDIQGVMGVYYARYDGEAKDVAITLDKQYQPRSAGNDLPPNPVVCALVIVDKMDTLAGIFGIGQHPKGDKDPFALRHAALSVLRITVEKNLNLDLQALTEEAVRLYDDKLANANVVDDVIDFMFGRFRAWYQDEGCTIDTIQAVLTRRLTRPADFDVRMKAVPHFRALEVVAVLAATNRYVSSILTKSDGVLSDRVDVSILREPEEVKLVIQVVVPCDKLELYFAEGRYRDALAGLAELHEPVGAFFDKVMVMVDDKGLHTNRLTMLEKLCELFLHAADISLSQ